MRLEYLLLEKEETTDLVFLTAFFSFRVNNFFDRDDLRGESFFLRGSEVEMVGMESIGLRWQSCALRRSNLYNSQHLIIISDYWIESSLTGRRVTNRK